MPRLAPNEAVIYEAVSNAFLVDVEKINSDSKKREAAEPRAVCMWLMVQHGYKAPEIMAITGYTKREMNRRIEHVKDLMSNNEEFLLKVYIAFSLLINAKFKAIDFKGIPPLKRGVAALPTSAQPIRLFQ